MPFIKWNEADDAKNGTDDVDKVYIGSDQVYPSSSNQSGVIISGGDDEVVANDYNMHIFWPNGATSFTVQNTGYVRLMMVAAGGAGGNAQKGAGGGGAGGLLWWSEEFPIVQAGTYTVDVGLGVSAANGGNTELTLPDGFTKFTAVGGGKGGLGEIGGGPTNGSTGGSGGGAGQGNGQSRNGGGNTSGQGNPGGQPRGGNWIAGGGGGGRGSRGGNGSGSTGVTSGGAGGAGILINATGVATYYAGGGGGNPESNASCGGNGGSGGLGGGGNAGKCGNGGVGGDALGGGGGAGGNVRGGHGVLVIGTHLDTTNYINTPYSNPRALSSSVNVSVNGGKYLFDGQEGDFWTVNTGVYTFNNVPSSHPIAFMTQQAGSGLVVAGGNPSNFVGSKTSTIDGYTYSYYDGTIILQVLEPCNTFSFECYYHGAMGGEDKIRYYNDDITPDDISLQISQLILQDQGLQVYIPLSSILHIIRGAVYGLANRTKFDGQIINL